MDNSQKPKVRVLRHSRGKLHPDIRPIVLEYKKSKKKTDEHDEEPREERYSEGLEDIQQFEGDAVRIAQRTSRAFTKSLDTYASERERSAAEKKDGAIEDFVHNSAAATSAFMKEASDLPLDVAESLNRTSYRKRLRQALRLSSKVLRLWRL